jgi:hypothetical protein
MDWTLAITRNRDALLRVIAALFALAGLAPGAKLTLLPRPVYRAFLRVLRPAESALRRLIMIAAHGLVLKAIPARAAPVGLIAKSGTPQNRAFPLIDPLKRFSTVAQDQQDEITFEFIDEDDAEQDDEDYDADGQNALPRISVPGLFDPVFAPPQAPALDDLIDATHLSRRLEALKRALADIPKQARRLARWQVRRDLALQQTAPFKPRRLSPFRPGPPPGATLRRQHEVDHILRECHLLMLDRLADTS